MPPINLLVKPTSGICNMRCRYCFYYDVAKNREVESYGFMIENTLDNMIQKALKYGERQCSITYQGGEPTLIGLDFFKKAVELQNKYNLKNIKINNSIQTNGYKLNKAWAEFFVKNNFLVGISLDGTKKTHDEFRKDIKAEGTFYEVLKTIELLNKYKVEFNILTVVNKKTAVNIDNIYKFYKKNRLKYIQFIACLDPIGCNEGDKEYSLTPEIYGKFLIELFDLWNEDLKLGKQPYIRQFENYINILMGYEPESCEQRGVCGFNHVVEADGEVYPCDFYVLDEYKLGNLNEVNFEEIQERREDRNFVKESLNHSERCKKCSYFAVCRGGCRRHRLIKNEDGTYENYLCEGYKMFFNYTLSRMRYIAMELRMVNKSNRNININKK